MPFPFRLASGALLSLLFAVNVYRAATQSITHDEAITYSWFVSQPWNVVFNQYDANHHVLYTIAAKLVTGLLGANEFTMRLPTLAACALYFWAMLRICEMLFGTGWLLLLSIAALSLNPLLFDFLSAARGYGMALAFFGAALYLLFQFLDQPSKRLLVAAGFAFAASVSSNLTYLIPSTGAILSVLALHGMRTRDRLPLGKAARWLIAPFLIPAWIVLIFPLSAAVPDQFYFGAHSWKQALDSLVVYSFLGPPAYPLLRDTVWLRQVSFTAMAIAVAGVAALALAALPRVRSATAPERGLLLIAGVTVSSLVAIAGGFHLAGIVLPVERTAIYWVFLLTLSGLLVLRFSPGPKWIQPLLAIPLLIVLTQYALEFRTTFYAAWLFHRNCRDLIAYVERDHTRLGARPITVSGSWEMAAPINFYRATRNLTWLAETDRFAKLDKADYWTFIEADAGEVEKRGLRIVWREPISGTVLAIQP